MTSNNNRIFIASPCQDDFSDKTEMESRGWSFSWNDAYVWRPNLAQYCGNVPLKSYCGFQYPGDGEISYTFTTSGRGNLSYGHSGNVGSVIVSLNDEDIGSRNSRGTSDIQFDHSVGDVLRIKELQSSVINIHSLCTNPIGTYLTILYRNKKPKSLR